MPTANPGVSEIRSTMSSMPRPSMSSIVASVSIASPLTTKVTFAPSFLSSLSASLSKTTSPQLSTRYMTSPPLFTSALMASVSSCPSPPSRSDWNSPSSFSGESYPVPIPKSSTLPTIAHRNAALSLSSEDSTNASALP